MSSRTPERQRFRFTKSSRLCRRSILLQVSVTIIVIIVTIEIINTSTNDICHSKSETQNLDISIFTLQLDSRYLQRHLAVQKKGLLTTSGVHIL